MIIKKEIVDSLFAQFGESDITQLSIREVGKLVAQIEQQSGQEFLIKLHRFFLEHLFSQSDFPFFLLS